MRRKKQMIAIGAVGLVLALLVSAAVVLGQGPDGDNSGPSATAVVVDRTDRSKDKEDPEPEGAIIFAQPPQTINYQGYLTDGSGAPLNGEYDLVFHLYDDPLAGTAEWGPETHSGVEVKDGLFQVALGATVTLYPNDFDEALYLAVQVDGTDVTPRQPLRAVPYAFGLVPGAEIEGNPDGSNFALSVTNLGEGSSDSGLYARGEKWGLYAEEVGENSDVGIYTPDFVHADGFRSSADSYFWVPATNGWFYPDPDCEAYPQYHGTVRIECSASGTVYYNIPIPVPAVLYGQEVRVESITVLYQLVNVNSYITTTRLRKTTGASSSVSVIYDDTDRLSTTSSSYSLSATDNYTLTTSSGALNLNLTITHDGSTTHDVYIGGVRVRLRHYDEP